MYEWAKDIGTNNGIKVWVFGGTLFDSIIEDILAHDFAFAIVSLILVYIYICIHLQSLFLGSLGILQVVFAFPMAFNLNRDIFRVSFYDSNNFLVVYIILGISTDNFFVVTDAWTQATAFPKMAEDLDSRMAFTYRRAVKAITVTSATTAIAFLATAASKIRPIAAFGLFAFSLVIVNYTITVFAFHCL